MSLEGLRIAVDCANGAAYKVAPTVLEELGAEVIAIGASPNGQNINADCGALHPENLGRTVREYRADLGVALDGDADRVVLLDEKGGAIDGDQILALCGIALKRDGLLRNDRIVGTSMSNLGLELELARHDIGLLRADVGDRYVVAAMREHDLVLGGESSGHVVFLDLNTTGDGILTALQVLALYRRQQQPLSQLAKVFDPCPQKLVSVRVAEKPPLDELAGLQAAIARIESDLEGRGRVLVRYSGTEPLVRVMVECSDGSAIDPLVEELSKELERAIGERQA